MWNAKASRVPFIPNKMLVQMEILMCVPPLAPLFENRKQKKPTYFYLKEFEEFPNDHVMDMLNVFSIYFDRNIKIRMSGYIFHEPLIRFLYTELDFCV